MKNRKTNENRVPSRMGNDDSAEESINVKDKLKLKRGASLEKSSSSERKKLVLIPLTLFIAVLGSYFYNIWLISLVNKPLNEPRIINTSMYKSPENLDRFWGTYRSNLYFGLKTRSENPLMAGMMWFNQFNKFNQHLKHWADQNDKLVKYGWIAHDGKNFGIHDLYESADNGFSIRNSWVKRHGGKDGGDWTVKTRVSPFSREEKPMFVSIIFYFSTDYTGWITKHKKTSTKSTIDGETEDCGKFKIKVELKNTKEQPHLYLDELTGNISTVMLKDKLVQEGYFTQIKTKSQDLKEYIGLNSRMSNSKEDSNFIAFQVSGMIPFEFDVLFESDSLRKDLESQGQAVPPDLNGPEFDGMLSKWHGEFVEKFEDKFKLKEKNFSSTAIQTAYSAFSNLLGSIGFFTGQSIVKSANSPDPVLYWKSNLYTAVPSRSFFPRGFIWDEGFHNILIGHWDLEITKDIIGHWLDLMNAEEITYINFYQFMNIKGWIPREVILGDEAKARVPSEFWIQRNTNANPPTFFLPLYKLIHKVNDSMTQNINKDNADAIYLNKIFKRLTYWYNWFNTTQVGKLPFTYRWRGRLSDSKSELNPKTLTSGLDDYPRASHPNEQERHLDLRCWMAWASKVMGDLSQIVSKTQSQDTNEYKLHYETLKDNRILDELHWSDTQYADYGLHSDKVKLVREKPSNERVPPNSMPMIRKVEEAPKYQYVNSVGYVSLFPMLLELIDPNSPKLNTIFDHIKDPKHLWTNYGLRSLSKNAPLYEKRNTEHDPPYWRSAIWININYLALKSLKYYSNIEGPYKQKAAQIYNDLRKVVIDNILKNYENTGYIWEQYSDITGRGQGSHPFTGWSALVVSIMAEIY